MLRYFIPDPSGRCVDPNAGAPVLDSTLRLARACVMTRTSASGRSRCRSADPGPAHDRLMSGNHCRILWPAPFPRRPVARAPSSRLRPRERRAAAVCAVAIQRFPDARLAAGRCPPSDGLRPTPRDPRQDSAPGTRNGKRPGLRPFGGTVPACAARATAVRPPRPWSKTSLHALRSPSVRTPGSSRHPIAGASQPKRRYGRRDELVGAPNVPPVPAGPIQTRSLRPAASSL